MGNIVNFIITLIIGGVSGWIAGKLMDSEGSMLRNIILGLVGGVVGSVVLGVLGISGSGLIGGILVSVFGACLLVFIAKKLIK